MCSLPENPEGQSLAITLCPKAQAHPGYVAEHDLMTLNRLFKLQTLQSGIKLILQRSGG